MCMYVVRVCVCPPCVHIKSRGYTFANVVFTRKLLRMDANSCDYHRKQSKWEAFIETLKPLDIQSLKWNGCQRKSPSSQSYFFHLHRHPNILHIYLKFNSSKQLWYLGLGLKFKWETKTKRDGPNIEMQPHHIVQILSSSDRFVYILCVVYLFQWMNSFFFVFWKILPHWEIFSRPIRKILKFLPHTFIGCFYFVLFSLHFAFEHPFQNFLKAHSNEI